LDQQVKLVVPNLQQQITVYISKKKGTISCSINAKYQVENAREKLVND
jgi:hypothetical protein